eukprot:gb/GFBE01083196.1/.p1 GENE.gb/GFBE01083196.1/~~gb/GFBE01083196.1/.p1  ORF type:complete len:228 (+),score=44.17 gb/GFBE01083196.1/:1-684(+)
MLTLSQVMAVTDRSESFRDWNLVYGTPGQPGKCRIFVRVVFEVPKIPMPLRLVFQYAFSPELPAFFTHLTNHRVLEDDNVFLHYQGQTLAPNGIQDPDWRERVYTPTSADAAVLHYRRWLEEFADGRVAWARLRATYLPRDKAALIERFHSHTAHCKSCSGALAAARSARRGADLAVLLGILGTALWIDGQWACAAASLAAALFKMAAEDVEQKLIEGEYPPPRNSL